MIVSLGATQQPPSAGVVIGSGAIAGGVAGTLAAIQSGSILRGAGTGAGMLLTSIAPFTGPAAPFVAAAGLALAAVSQLFKGCGTTCTQTSDVANQVETIVKNLVAQYMAAPVHYRSTQLATVTAIQDALNQLYAFCSQPSMGPAGQRCISERLVEGGSAPWCPTRTGCDWITTYLHPVANDPHVVDDSASSMVAGQLSSALGLPAGSDFLTSPLVWVGVGLLVAGAMA